MFHNVGAEIKKTIVGLVLLQTVPYLLSGVGVCVWMADQVGIFWTVLMAAGVIFVGYGLSHWCAVRILRLGELKGRCESTHIYAEQADK